MFTGSHLTGLVSVITWRAETLGYSSKIALFIEWARKELSGLLFFFILSSFARFVKWAEVLVRSCATLSTNTACTSFRVCHVNRVFVLLQEQFACWQASLTEGSVNTLRIFVPALWTRPPSPCTNTRLIKWCVPFSPPLPLKTYWLPSKDVMRCREEVRSNHYISHDCRTNDSFRSKHAGFVVLAHPVCCFYLHSV